MIPRPEVVFEVFALIGASVSAAIVLSTLVSIFFPIKPADPKDRAPTLDNVCTDKHPCVMRKKIALVPTILPYDLCGVPDSFMADFMVWDKVSPSGKKVLSFRFCPWCGKAFHWLGKTWEHADEESTS